MNLTDTAVICFGASTALLVLGSLRAAAKEILEEDKISWPALGLACGLALVGGLGCAAALAFFI